MTIRHARLKVGDTAWLNCHSPYERPDLVDHVRVSVLRFDREHHVCVRIEEGPQAGMEATLLHWLVVRWQFELEPGVWRDEGHPSTLAALAGQLAAMRRENRSVTLERDHAECIASTERILARHSPEKLRNSLA